MNRGATNLEIIYRETAGLIPYAANSRTHSPEQIAQIAASVREFGFCNPILIDEDGGIIAGHGRVMAAQKLGLESVPTITLAHLTDAQRRAYVIADNKLALNAGWDEHMLAAEIDRLNDEDGFNIRLLGFSDVELREIGCLEPPDGGEGEGGGDSAPAAKLSDRFMIPPFSVLNAREGWWQDRKRAWLALGIKSEIGRGDGSGKPL